MKKFFLFISVVTVLSSNAQKRELGEVTLDELNQKFCPADTSAPAAVLFSLGKTYFEYSENEGFRIITEIQTKIKIYKKEGYEYANAVERIYTGGGSSEEKVSFTKAVTYNLIDGKIEKTKLNSSGEFREEINKYWALKKITMPNVREGSIIEYKVMISSPYIHNFPEWVFQKSIPVLYSEYTTVIPEYFTYSKHFRGYHSPIISKDYKERSVYNTSNSSSSGGFRFREETSKYVIENIAALKEEIFTSNINNYRTTLVHELSTTQYPNSQIKRYSTDWETVAKEIYVSSNFGDELKKTGYFEKDVDGLLQGVSDPEERMAILFGFVRNRMNWNEFYGVFCKDGVKKVYAEKKGNVAELNLMLVSMLRYAGLNANPVIISTRNNGIPLFPSQTSFNYVIVAVKFQDKIYLMDATSKYSIPNILPTRDLNWQGRIIQSDGTNQSINLMPSFLSKSATTLMAKIDKTGVIEGKVREMYFDYEAFDYRTRYGNASIESQMERLEKRHSGIEVSDFSVQNNLEISKPIVESYSFKDNHSVELIGGKLHISPLLFKTLHENPFKQDEREYPVDFIYPHEDKTTISLTIPEGYEVEVLPEGKAFTMPENIAGFKYMIQSAENQIQIILTLDINQAIIGSENYEFLRSLFNEFVKKNTEKIILKKV